MATRYSVEIDGDFFVNFDTDGEYIADTFEVDGEPLRFDSISEVESFLAKLFDAVGDEVERVTATTDQPQPTRIRVKTGQGRPTTAKKITTAVERIETQLDKALRAIQQDRETDMEISRLMHDKLNREADDQALIALLI